MINYKEGIKSPRRRSNKETASHNSHVMKASTVTDKWTSTHPRNIAATVFGYSQDRNQTKQAAIILTFFLELFYHWSEWAGQSSQGDWQPLLACITTLQAANDTHTQCYFKVYSSHIRIIHIHMRFFVFFSCYIVCFLFLHVYPAYEFMLK